MEGQDLRAWNERLWAAVGEYRQLLDERQRLIDQLRRRLEEAEALLQAVRLPGAPAPLPTNYPPARTPGVPQEGINR